MYIMQYKPTETGSFYNDLFDKLKVWEEVRSAPYDSKDGAITIGIGYNLTTGASALRTGVLTQFGLNVNASINSTDPSEQLEAAYVQALIDAMKAGPSEIQ